MTQKHEEPVQRTLLARGKIASTLLNLFKRLSKLSILWCGQHRLSVSNLTTLSVPFRKKGWLKYSAVRCLVVKLDAKQTRNVHKKRKTPRAKQALWVCQRFASKTRELLCSTGSHQSYCGRGLLFSGCLHMHRPAVQNKQLPVVFPWNQCAQHRHH